MGLAEAYEEYWGTSYCPKTSGTVTLKDYNYHKCNKYTLKVFFVNIYNETIEYVIAEDPKLRKDCNGKEYYKYLIYDNENCLGSAWDYELFYREDEAKKYLAKFVSDEDIKEKVNELKEKIAWYKSLQELREETK